MRTQERTQIWHAIAATTAAVAISYLPGSGGPGQIVPSRRFDLPIAELQPWNLDYGLSEMSTFAVAEDTRLRTIGDFAERVLSVTTDLEPDIVDALKDDFWSLI